MRVRGVWVAGVFGVGLASVMLLSAIQPLDASSNGINGFSGNPASNGGNDCTSIGCHTGGNPPTVTIIGPTSVAPGSTNVYQLRISGGQGIAGGLDVSADLGTLGITDMVGTQLEMNAATGNEVTHTMPKNAVSGNVIWQFSWTAPLTAGTATIYGAGNSINANNNSSGDYAETATLQIQVTGGSTGTPGEASGDGLAPLLVTGYDPLTGNLSLNYEAGCESDSHNIYYGPLSAVDTYGYAGETCDIGNSGAYGTFNPGTDSYFFLLVGNKATDEGSYGKDGSDLERPDFALNACGQTQTLADTCDAN